MKTYGCDICESIKTFGMSWHLVVTVDVTYLQVHEDLWYVLTSGCNRYPLPTVQSNTIYSIHFYAQFEKTSEIEEACYVMSKGWSWHRMSNCRSEWVILPRPLDVHEEYNDLQNGRSLATPAWLWLLEKQETLALLCSPISVIHDWEARLEYSLCMKENETNTNRFLYQNIYFIYNQPKNMRGK